MLCKHPYRRLARASPLQVVIADGVREGLTPYPCGQCLPCRINKARIWANRLDLEGRLHNDKIFVTLTYSDEHIPENNSLSKKHTQDFFKRLRRVTAKRLRYYCAGEYGTKTDRPHYHYIIYGIGVSSESELLIQQCWPFGHIQIGDVTPQIS